MPETSGMFTPRDYNPGMRCDTRVETGFTAYPCTLSRDHDGPHYAIESGRSRRGREAWEAERKGVENKMEADLSVLQQQAAALMAPHDDLEVKAAEALTEPVFVFEEDLEPEPTKTREGDQVLPSGAGACVQDRVIAEMEDSKKVGIERYGTVLKTFNGRKGIQDVREELRDAFVYLSQVEMEAEATREELVEAVTEAFVTDSRYGSLTPKIMADIAVNRILGHVVGKYIIRNEGNPE